VSQYLCVCMCVCVCFASYKNKQQQIDAYINGDMWDCWPWAKYRWWLLAIRSMFSWIPSILCSIVSKLSCFRSEKCPLGSPIRDVAPPSCKLHYVKQKSHQCKIYKQKLNFSLTAHFFSELLQVRLVYVRPVPKSKTSGNCWGRTFAGQTPFLLPNQQHQSTECQITN